MNNQTCENCKYWVQDVSPFEERGWCKRYPPTVTSHQDSFPVIIKTEWCGEWKALEDD